MSLSSRWGRLDLNAGTIVHTVALEPQDPGALAGVGLDPDGRWLWVSEANVGLDLQHPTKPYAPLVVTRRDPLSGVVEAQRRDIPSVIGGQLLPVPNGIWIAASGGHFMFLERLDPYTLTVDATWNHSSNSVGDNSTTATVIGRRLWLLIPIPNTTISCGDVNTGAVLATRQRTDLHFGSPIAVIDHQLVVATAAGLDLTAIPPECQAS